ncbi:MAG: S-layer homology domain-containing protein [Caldiserica bacterium]|nr:S-layer homology domain-containing protein [Caldisericota bacterium]MDH7562476.1 S-layer homology domain-containing protein [Caldisericota bacterium]
MKKKVLVLVIIFLLLFPISAKGEEDRFRQEQRDTFHQAEVLSLAWDYDGNQALATGSSSGRILISFPGLRLAGYSLEAPNQVCVRSLSWFPGTSLLLAGSGDYGEDGSFTEGWIFLWDIRERNLKFSTRVSQYPVLSTSVNPFSQKFAVGVGAMNPPGKPLSLAQVQFWELEKKDPTRVLDLGEGSISALSFSPDGKKLAVSIWKPFEGNASGQALVIQGENFDQFQILGYRPYTSISWSPDSRQLALGFGSPYLEPGKEIGGLEIFDLGSGERKAISSWEARVNCVSWSPDGALIACGDSQGVIRLFLPDGTLKQKIERNWDSVNGVSWKKVPEGNKPVLASVSDDGTIRTFTLKPPTFSDLGGHWAEDFIDSLVERGAIQGFPDNTFRPDSLVTRAQAVKVILLSLGIQPTEASLPYSDISPGHWAYKFVATASKLGIVKGYPDGTFKPEGFITRGEILAMICRAVGWREESPSGSFLFPQDVPQEDWVAGYLRAFLASGSLRYPDPPIISEEGLFFPSQPATRGETCFLLERALRKGKLLI